MIARRRITDITGQIAGGLPAAFLAMLTAAGRTAGRFPRPAAVSAAAVLLAAVLAPAACSAAAPTRGRGGCAGRGAGAGHATGSGAALALLLRRVPVRHRPGAVELPGPARRDDQHRRGQAPGDRSGSPRRDAVLQPRRPDGADRELRDRRLRVAPGGDHGPVGHHHVRPPRLRLQHRGALLPDHGGGEQIPRGRGPSAACPSSPSAPGRTAAFERTWARFDARCAQRNGSLLDHDTTADVARDMNLLREAVGAPMLNYLGVSYGTGLGATYANLFPATTGHMILDGNLNPVAWTHPDGELSTFLRQGTDQASAATMRAFLDLCGKTTTSACAFSAGTPAATRAKWAALLRRLCWHPVTIGTPPQTYTYADAVVTVPLGAVNQWQAGAACCSNSGWPRAPAAAGGGQPSRARPGQPARHRRDRAPGRLHRRGADARRPLLRQPEPARPGRLPGRRAQRLHPVGRLRPGGDVERGGVRELACRRGPGPLLRSVEPAHGHHHPGSRQHRRPEHALPGLGRDVPGPGPRPAADRRRVRAHREQQPERLRHKL